MNEMDNGTKNEVANGLNQLFTFDLLNNQSMGNVRDILITSLAQIERMCYS